MLRKTQMYSVKMHIIWKLEKSEKYLFHLQNNCNQLVTGISLILFSYKQFKKEHVYVTVQKLEI